MDAVTEYLECDCCREQVPEADLRTWFFGVDTCLVCSVCRTAAEAAELERYYRAELEEQWDWQHGEGGR